MLTAWITDPHLNFVNIDGTEAFAKRVKDTGVEACLITGDIGESQNVCRILTAFSNVVEMPVHFVLGNHDYWHSSFQETFSKVVDLCNSSPWLNYLQGRSPIRVSDRSLIMGVDGWYDGLAGIGAMKCGMQLWDSTYIEDLRFPTRFQFSEKLRELGKESADQVEKLLSEANEYSHINNWTLLTHVPPFHGASWYDGRISNVESAPLFVNAQLGERLMYLMEQKYPTKDLTVLCGHTHHKSVYTPLDNLIVRCGEAEYGLPKVGMIIDL